MTGPLAYHVDESLSLLAGQLRCLHHQELGELIQSLARHNQRRHLVQLNLDLLAQLRHDGVDIFVGVDRHQPVSPQGIPMLKKLQIKSHIVQKDWLLYKGGYDALSNL